MAIYSDVTKESVLAAIREYDKLGQEAFLEKYGYGEATKYVLVHNGKRYDSKAILGVAWWYEHPEEQPLENTRFSGGRETVVPHLRDLGFRILDVTEQETPPRAQSLSSSTSAEIIPLVLVENESTTDGDFDFWRNATGEHYHFLNRYRTKIQEGAPFIYYRGARRRDGSTGTPEYFGWGRVGTVSRDPEISLDEPKNRWRWYCEIDEYHPFSSPVPARIDGEYWEEIEHQNLWQVSVREITAAVFSRILEAADYSPVNDLGTTAVPPSEAELAQEDTDLLVVSTRRSTSGESTGRGSGSPRRSHFAKKVGDWAEEYVLRHLRENLPAKQAASVRWVADAGERPGWDIEYLDVAGALAVVEVKGTTGARFPNFELTANEWSAAQKLKGQYVVILVAECCTSSPKIQRIVNPFGLHNDGELDARPQAWLLSGIGSS